MPSPPYRIALVDDDLEFLDSLDEFFTARGCQVDTWHRPTLAFRFLRRLAPDAVVLDFDMPGLSGLQILERLRGCSETSQLPVLLLTAHNQPEIRDAGWSQQLDDFIPKGTAQHEIYLRLTRAIERARPLRQSGPLSGQPAGPGAVQAWDSALGARMSGGDSALRVFALRLPDLDGLRASDRPELYQSFAQCFAAAAHRLRDRLSGAANTNAQANPGTAGAAIEAAPGLVYLLASAERPELGLNTHGPERFVAAVNRRLRQLAAGQRQVLLARESGLERRPLPQLVLVEFRVAPRAGLDLAAFEGLTAGLLAEAGPGFTRHIL